MSGMHARNDAQEEEEEEDEEGEEDVDSEDEEMKKFTRYYDPNQDRKKRQQVKRKSRKLDREIIGEPRMEREDWGIRNTDAMLRQSRRNHS